ncbi:MAG: DUF4810 domain-containing protein [Bacteroidales bacterium]|jgi:hypothetical protein|nr:DUF4810 domain-containing protein [Bacteroidales bacterium]
MRKFIILSVICFAFCSCNKALYLHYNYDELIYTYVKGGWSDKDNKKIVKQYKKIVDVPKGKDIIPPPGSCADYGFMLFKQGDTVKAKEYFQKEILLYPESRSYMNKLLNDLDL